MKHMVVLTGAGISAESGLKTFRDQGGLWEDHDVTKVANIDGWNENPELVLRFYNDRRKQLAHAKPNGGHKGLAKLEKYFDVDIITQNVDNLHEKAGSTKVFHLHGELTKVRSTLDATYNKDIGYKEINLGDKCPKGGQLRPDIVWFGEPVTAIERAIEITETADIFVVIGSSLVVYPAAGLIDYVPESSMLYLIDPNPISAVVNRKYEFIKEIASTGVEILIEKLLKVAEV